MRWTASVTEKVYPRPHGGAQDTPIRNALGEGLSPPTRGSRRYPAATDGGRGSIPAHAGEPARTTPCRQTSRVYPRPRGGAEVAYCFGVPIKGLSPPTRGSLAVQVEGEIGRGSIPAHAGEPLPGVAVSPVRSGLSPPTRGSLVASAVLVQLLGSIPAHAGEPSRASGRHVSLGVYPRPRGGAGLPRVTHEE